MLKRVVVYGNFLGKMLNSKMKENNEKYVKEELNVLKQYIKHNVVDDNLKEKDIRNI
jgi:hypothetical protein